MSSTEINMAVNRVRAEFSEMPGLRLSLPQAARLWGFDQADCRHVVDTLEHRGFLRWTSKGLIVRAEDAR
jgi:hypothetical protein